MKKTVILTMLITLVLAAAALPSEPEVSINRTLSSMPLAFTENQGQWDDKILFRAEAGGGATMWFTSTGPCFQFTRRVPVDDAAGKPAPPARHFDGRNPDGCETMMISASFLGANPHPTVVGEDILEYRCNYFLSDDPSRWRTDVANYGAIVYKEIYPGIDLKYYGNGRQIEYDIIVAPGADLSRVRIRYEGVESVAVNDAGQLVVRTMWGEVTESRPIVYQVDNGERVLLDGRYEPLPDNSFGFALAGEYNPTLPLVIDPVLSFSTYLGGSEFEKALDIALDPGGRSYVTGYTASADFPVMNPYQTYAGDYDVFVTKIDFYGAGLVYSTFIGGTYEDRGVGIAVDMYGAAYITGITWSQNFPTVNPYQGTNWDPPKAFVTKLSTAGNSLVYSTYLGGNGEDIGEAIAVDATGAAYLAGSTSSTNFPLMYPIQPYRGSVDAFVTRLTDDGTDLIYSTYLGGSGIEYGWGLAIDASGSAYVTGVTTSHDFPVLNPFQTDQGPDADAFVTKLSPAGSSLAYSTYLGGTLEDQSDDIVVDASGVASVAGWTASTDFPTRFAYQTFQGNEDAFVTKLSETGNNLIFSTYLGGSGYDAALGIAMGIGQSVYVTGYTNSIDYPLVSPSQAAIGGGYDALVTRIGESGDNLLFSTYLGGSETDCGYRIAILGGGLMEVVGYTNSADFPLVDPLQTDQGGTDAFVAHIDPGCCILRGDVNHDATCNPLDAAYFVAYLWSGGPAPP